RLRSFVLTQRPKPHAARVRTKDRRRSATEQNRIILDSLEKEYGPVDSSNILDAAQGSHHYRNPQAATNAEPYELLESGHIDIAIENFGFKPWVIGRPKNLG